MSMTTKPGKRQHPDLVTVVALLMHPSSSMDSWASIVQDLLALSHLLMARGTIYGSISKLLSMPVICVCYTAVDRFRGLLARYCTSLSGPIFS